MHAFCLFPWSILSSICFTSGTSLILSQNLITKKLNPMRTPFIWLLLFFWAALNLQSQKPIDQLWAEATPQQLPSQEKRLITPQAYRSLQLNFEQMKSLLAHAPSRFGESPKKSDIIMPLPLPDGRTAHFRVYDAPVMHPDLAAKYPGIRSFVGQGVEDPTAIVRFDYTPEGFHAMVLSAEYGTVFIDPYAKGNTDFYMSYFKRDFVKKDGNFSCHVDEIAENLKKPTLLPQQKIAGDCQLRTYRLALACTGEYAQYHGGTVTGALAAMNTTMTRVNGIFERDAAITMQLVANNDQLIFLDPATDPYTNNDGGAMLSQNQTTCDNIIGSANYDIGHVFSTGGGGVAFLESPCSSNKAKGVTGQANPVGDPFDVDYVAHEMGHQYGGRHTQNNNCNRDAASSYEPGSASTIMGYAGICPPDIQSNSDDHFHINSIILMGNFVTGAGNSCPTVTTTGNNPPVANAGSDYTIPRSTPFKLEGSGSDPDGDALTYCWEQYDKEIASMPPQPTNTAGPAFRSLSPVNTPVRYVPNLDAVVNGSSPTWEVLSDVNRTYHFRLTVRDNFAGAGCTDDDEMIVTVDATTGPFVVTAPNTPVSWDAGTMQTVSWNVAGTNSGAVNTPNVDILLSLDGGYTYPIVLATAVPNDGSETITVPNMPTTTARIQVRGAGNIFYDISDTNFTIVASSGEPDFAISMPNPQNSVCPGVDATFVVQIDSIQGFTGDVQLSVNGLPASLSTSFSINPVTAPGISVLTVSGTDATAPGTYSFEVSGTASTGTHIANGTLVILSDSLSVPTLLSPANGAVGVNINPTLNWNSSGTQASYFVQVALDSLFTNIVESGTVMDTSYTAGPLMPDTTYYWRVFAQNECAETPFSEAFSFTTVAGPTLCLPPTNPTAVTSPNTATISWLPVPQALKYNIRYRIMGSTDPWKQKGTFANHITLVGLSANTTYEYQLRSRCPEGLTEWSALYSFTTTDGMDSPDCTPFVPIEPISTGVTSAVITWHPEPGAFLYRLKYRALGSDNWIRVTSADTMEVLNGLDTATTYELQTKTLCAFGWTPWSDSIYQFTTQSVFLLKQKPTGEMTFSQPSGKWDSGQEVILFPNPATDELTIRRMSVGTAKTTLSIRNLAGDLLYAAVLNGEETVIHLARWPAGMYILQLASEGQEPLIRRFVKK